MAVLFNSPWLTYFAMKFSTPFLNLGKLLVVPYHHLQEIPEFTKRVQRPLWLGRHVLLFDGCSLLIISMCVS